METYQNLDTADMSGEVWKQFRESRKKYFLVSNLGRIKSKDKKTEIEMIRKQRLKKQVKKKDGTFHERLYIQITGKDLLKPTEAVSRIVAQTFIDNPKNLPVVCHNDNNPKNNTVANLRFGTQAENIQQAYADGLMNNRGVNNTKNMNGVAVK